VARQLGLESIMNPTVIQNGSDLGSKSNTLRGNNTILWDENAEKTET